MCDPLHASSSVPYSLGMSNALHGLSEKQTGLHHRLGADPHVALDSEESAHLTALRALVLPALPARVPTSLKLRIQLEQRQESALPPARFL